MSKGEEIAFAEDDGYDEAGPHMLYSDSFEEEEAILISSSMDEGNVDDDVDEDIFLLQKNFDGSELPNMSERYLCTKNNHGRGENCDTSLTHRRSQTLCYGLSSFSHSLTPSAVAVSPASSSFSRSSFGLNPEELPRSRNSYLSSVSADSDDLATPSSLVAFESTEDDLDFFGPSVNSLSASPQESSPNRKNISAYPPSAGVSSMKYHRRSKSTTDVIESSMFWLQNSMLEQDHEVALSPILARRKSNNVKSCKDLSYVFEDDLLLEHEESDPSGNEFYDERGRSERSNNIQDNTCATIFRQADDFASSIDGKDEF